MGDSVESGGVEGLRALGSAGLSGFFVRGVESYDMGGGGGGEGGGGVCSKLGSLLGGA